ncbi:MAG: hypothetical protein ACOYMF_05310 [Bacteroidales bacterium]
MRKPKPHQQPSIINSILKQKPDYEIDNQTRFLLSFSHLDSTQGDSLKDWENNGMLARAIDTLSGLCKDNLTNQLGNQKFKNYGSFPPKNKTDYIFPKHITEEASWSSIHVTGKQCIIGHVVRNVFYVVFLDGQHRFWISELS